MRLLAEEIRLISPDGVSVLYSDIDPEFYRQNGGWKVVGASELVIPSENDFTETCMARSVTMEDASASIARDVDMIREELNRCEAESTVFQMIPQVQELEWAVTRANVLADCLKIPLAKEVGAQIDSQDGWGYVLWSHDHESSTLKVLRFREPAGDSDMTSLLQSLKAQAGRYNLKQIKIWSPSDRLEQLSGIKRSWRNDSLPCLLHFGGEVVHWKCPERLGWC
jgi:LYC1 GNAT-like C-terminal domain